MIGLAVSFPGGRYHATPWGRHVNEAAPEWPPSPWRILRTFVATWKRKLDNDTGCAPQIVKDLMRKLAAPPLFVLPPASLGHTRHFMPWFKKAPTDRTLIFDGFVALDKNHPVICLWPELELDQQESDVVDKIISNVVFLGRSESWTEARVLIHEEAAMAFDNVNCMPVIDNYDKSKFDTVRVLCADPVTAFENSYTPKHTSIEGRGGTKQTIITPLYDPDWHLCMETLELHDKRWSDPPGSCWATYLRLKDCFAVQPKRSRTVTARLRPTMARYAVDGSVLPLVEDTLRVAESARRTAMGCFGRLGKKRLNNGNVPADAPLPRSEVFSGKDEQSTPLEGHRHAYFLPTDEDGDGRIDHLTIIAAMGFGPAEVKALDRMNLLKRDDGDPLNLMLIALGQSSEILAPIITGPSRVWISATPFIVTRFPKARGQKKDPVELLGLENQREFARQVLIEEIRRAYPDLIELVKVEYLNEEHRCGAHGLRPIQFKRYRQKRGDDGGSRPAGVFRIVFPESVHGPICLGHSSHFGLGLFVPETDDNK
jgi:CRISPR-associated protein Csb2